MRWGLVALAAFLGWVAPDSARAAEPEVSVLVPVEELRRDIQRIAVPAAIGEGIARPVLAALSDVLLGEVSRTGLQVTGASDIEAMLGLEKQKDLLGCSDASCMAEIAGALGVDALITLRVGRLGATWILTCSLVDVRHSRAAVRGSWRGKLSDEELVEQVARLGARVVSAVVPAKAATAALVRSAPSAPAAPPAATATAAGAPSQLDDEATLLRAQDAYVHGQYAETIAMVEPLTQHPGVRTKAYRLAGAASCFLKQRSGAVTAYENLDSQGRTFLKYVCDRNGITIP